MDSIEKPIVERIQDFTDQINAEKVLKIQLDEISRTGKINFNLKRIEL
jgi:hypothetical protein